MTIKVVAWAALLAVASAFVATSPALADEEADHAALRELVKLYEATIQKGDPSLLQPYLANDFTGVMVTGEEVNDYPSLVAYWKKIQEMLGDGGKYSVQVNVPTPATIVGDLAFAHGTTADTAVTSDGKEYHFKGFWTAIATRQADGWKIVRIHGSMDAIANTFVATSLQWTAMSSAVVGGLVGVAIGAFAFWVFARRRRIEAAS